MSWLNLAISQHKDEKAGWPWYRRLWHWLFDGCDRCRAGKD